MTEKDVITRIGSAFNKEIENIKRQRLEEGVDKKKKSTRALTDLIITHEDWPKIKKDTIYHKFGNNNGTK